MLTTTASARPTRLRSLAPPLALLEPDSDRMLVIRAADGDDRAFATIIRRYSQLLRATAARTLGSSADVDDVVQETFLAAWTHVDSVIDGETIAGWLVTTVRRRSVDRLRSSVSRLRAELDDEFPAPADDDPEHAAHCGSLTADANRVLAALPAAQRRCWELRQLEQRSYEAIARELGLSASTVRGLLARARATLRSELAHWR
ncbi:RNA polymerase subunit sigma-70 [Rathayibacter rathayi]|uniref:RNA polymerase subunit sigma-70 n=1 Tax=Rathayibacter rathayi TaxID=33887 RepID=A0ABD6W7E8_RATRA|nr:RNA polymerase sigma factor [Rathayibacter rathayi]PPF11733.1 RNA polymerase subunit sigma-70 [Rathayibacter rathayi]PPF78879.1 RNA polymerase subunit sigma-70 [Rathayibacter rathayi]PPG12136.1 RNA polymerase subunit sigma-70 [Rathayibacter rathayi]PPG67039.1 RNA polymerase subunit sigma-70 [Rathayibacter rathayi]PPG75366.1 RNA polymerase subunit sigma-70 [Rathayibacter rathayi]